MQDPINTKDVYVRLQFSPRKMLDDASSCFRPREWFSRLIEHCGSL